jgi:kynurenine formamidase
MDAFSHFIAGGMSLDQITVKNLIAPLAVIDIHERARRDADTMVTVDDIKAGKSGMDACRRVPPSS